MALAPDTSETLRSARVRIQAIAEILEPMRTSATMPEAREIALTITHLEDADLRLVRALDIA